MSKAHKASRSYGKCCVCKLTIRKGQMYVRFFRHATEAERNNPKVRTLSPFRGLGPQVEMMRHEDCPHPKLSETF